MRAWRALVRGSVQNVGFRHATKRKADEMGLFGTVRNLTDGRVEIVLHGERGKIEALVLELKKRPFPTRIDEVHIESCEVDVLQSFFEIV